MAKENKDQRNIVTFTISVINTGEPEAKEEPTVMGKTSFRADSDYTDSIREHLSKVLAGILKDYDVDNDTPKIVTEDGTTAGAICWDAPEAVYQWQEEWEATLGTEKNQKVTLFVKEHFKAANDDGEGSDEDDIDDLLENDEDGDEEEDFDLPDEDEQASSSESEEAEGEDGDEEEEEVVKVKKPAARKRKAESSEKGENGGATKKSRAKKAKDESEYSSDKEEVEVAAEEGEDGEE